MISCCCCDPLPIKASFAVTPVPVIVKISSYPDMRRILASAVSVVLALCLLQPAVSVAEEAFYKPGSVASLERGNFYTKIRSGGVWLVEFYAPWCSYAVKFKPHYLQAAQQLKPSGITVAAYDCEEGNDMWSAGLGLCNELGINASPTLVMAYVAKNGKVSYIRADTPKTAKDVVTFAQKQYRVASTRS